MGSVSSISISEDSAREDVVSYGKYCTLPEWAAASGSDDVHPKIRSCPNYLRPGRAQASRSCRVSYVGTGPATRNLRHSPQIDADLLELRLPPNRDIIEHALDNIYILIWAAVAFESKHGL